MRLRHLLAISAAAVAGLAVLPATSLAAPPAPYGHACTPKDGARFCPTSSDAARVPSFDGVPLDVDVYLPASGDGPFPTIAFLHGWGGDKSGYQSEGPAWAKLGYAVVIPSARGFGRSCGKADSRTAPGCDRGWFHLGDSRYEVRDVQTLLGRLVDEGVAKAGALGATGGSYGGGTSLQLAYLNDRSRLPDGSYTPWKSPAGTPLRLAAAWPVVPWSDLADALVPNGRSFLTGASTYGYAAPVGVEIKAYQDGLYGLGQSVGFPSAKGVDPGADLTTWKARVDQGEPYDAQAGSYLKELHDFHGAGGIAISKAQKPSPLLITQGFTDDLFPVWQGIRPFEQARRAGGEASLLLGDLGHDRGANHPKDTAAFRAKGEAFFGHWLKGEGAKPRNGVVTAYGQRCPRKAPSGIGPWTASSFGGLAKGALAITGATGTITSSGGDAALAAKISPLGLDACKALKVARAPGTLQVATKIRRGATLLGSTKVALRYRVTGANAQVVARIWDRDPKAGTARLVDRSITRLPSGRRVTLRLNGNGWKFAKGHELVVELLGRDAPTFRPSNGTFKVAVSRVTVSAPTREARAS